MADPNNDFWSTFWPGVGTALAASVLYGAKKIWDLVWAARSEALRAEKEDEAKRRQILRTVQDQATEELKRVYGRNAELEKENTALRAEVRLWEARARRVDEIAHALRLGWSNERQTKGILDGAPIPRIPLLEESLS